VNQPEPRLRPTKPATLVVAALASAAVAWFIISTWYGSMPPLPWLPAVTLLVLAIGEFVLAQQTRARIERRPGRPPVEPLAVARYAALAKASSLAGAIFAGFSLGLVSWLLIERQTLSAAADDLPSAVVSLIASAALVGAGLWLERACRVPEPPDQDDSNSK
jgi:hypothetical protein